MEEEQISELIKILTSLVEKMSEREKEGDTSMGPRIEALRRSIADLTKRLDNSQKGQQDHSKLTRDLLELQRSTTREQRQRDEKNNKEKKDNSSKTLENILQELKRGSSGQQGSLNLSQNNDKMTSGASRLAESFGKLSGILGGVLGKFNDFYSRISSVNGTMSSAIGVLGGLSAGLAGAAAWIDQQNQAYRMLMNSAEGTIRSMDDMNRFASLAGMNVTQFTEAMKNGTAGMKMIGGQQFATTLREVRTALDAAGSLGYTHAELTDAFGSYLEEQRQMGLINQLDFKDMGEKMKAMLEADQKMAQLMGISTEEVRQRREQAMVDPAWQMYQRGISEEERKKNQAVIDAAPKEFQQSMKEFFMTGGAALTTASANMQATMGSDLYRQLNQLKQNSVDGRLTNDGITQLYDLLRKVGGNVEQRGRTTFSVGAMIGSEYERMIAEALHSVNTIRDPRAQADNGYAGTQGGLATRQDQASADPRTNQMLRMEWAIQDASAQVMRSISEVMGKIFNENMLGKFNDGVHKFADSLNNFNNGDSYNKLRELVYGSAATALTAMMAGSVALTFLGGAATAIASIAGLSVLKMAAGGIIEKLTNRGNNASGTNIGDVDNGRDNRNQTGRPGRQAGARIGMRAGGLVGAALTAYGVYNAYSDASEQANQQLATGQITEQQRNQTVGSAMGRVAGENAMGVAGGVAAGAATGAAIGSVVPVVGTAIGGLVGGALGGMAGSQIGEWLGINNILGDLGASVGSSIGGLFGSDQQTPPPGEQTPPTPTPQQPTTIPPTQNNLPTNGFDYVRMADLFGQRMQDSLTRVLQERIIRVVDTDNNTLPSNVNLTTETLQQLRDIMANSGGLPQVGTPVPFSPRVGPREEDNRERVARNEQADENTLLQREQLKAIRELLDITRTQKTMLDQYQALLNATVQQVEVNTRNTYDGIQSLIETR